MSEEAEVLDELPACESCGSDLEWVDCWNLCEDGWFDEYELVRWWGWDGELSRCDVCRGEGGWWVCTASAKFCPRKSEAARS